MPNFATDQPPGADALRVKLDSFACRWDAVLDIFPDGMVERLDRMMQEGWPSL